MKPYFRHRRGPSANPLHIKRTGAAPIFLGLLMSENMAISYKIATLLWDRFATSSDPEAKAMTFNSQLLTDKFTAVADTNEAEAKRLIGEYSRTWLTPDCLIAGLYGLAESGDISKAESAKLISGLHKWITPEGNWKV